MKPFSIFLPVTKVDQAQRLVYGVAAVEEIDNAKEIFDYATSKPHFAKWSEDCAKFSGGKSLGNVRAMHGKVAAGRLDQLVFNDSEKQIEVCSKIVDDNEWKKVEEGVYTGFSIGGKYEKRWKDGDNTRYTAVPSEVSIVDNPCQPGARFTMTKMDGSSEDVPFVSIQEKTMKVEVTNDQVAARARELAKAAGAEDKWPSHVEAARAELTKADGGSVLVSPEAIVADDIKPGSVPADVIKVNEINPTSPTDDLSQVWLAKDGKTFAKKSDAVAHNAELAKTASPAEQLAAAVGDLATAVEKAEAAPAAAAVDTPVVEKAEACADAKKDGETAAKKDDKKKKGMPWAKKAAGADDLHKGLYAVGRLASLIQELTWLVSDAEYEAASEDDASSVPASLKDNAKLLAETLKAMVAEETAELFAEKMDGVDLAKVEGIDSLQKLLGSEGPEALVKFEAPVAVDPSNDLQKALVAEQGKVSVLEKAVGDALPIIQDLAKRLKAIEDQPMPRPGEVVQPVVKVTVVDKTADDAAAAGLLLTELQKSNPGALSEAFIRIAQRQPMSMLNRG